MRTSSISVSWTLRGLRPEDGQVSMRLAGSLDLLQVEPREGPHAPCL